MGAAMGLSDLIFPHGRCAVCWLCGGQILQCLLADLDSITVSLAMDVMGSGRSSRPNRLSICESHDKADSIRKNDCQKSGPCIRTY